MLGLLSAERIWETMKLPSLKLESKVLLTAIAISVFGVLRMTHIVHLSDQQDIGFLFLIGFVLAALILRKDRNSSATNAVFFLCFGLYYLNRWTPSKSEVEVFFRAIALVISGVGFLISAFSAIKAFRNEKEKETPEMQGNN
jgi:K+-sensing histidine kinase KdpD